MTQKSDQMLAEILVQLHDLEEKIEELQNQTYAEAYAEAWMEGMKEGRGCRQDENVLSGPDDKIETSKNENEKINAKTAPKSPERSNLEDDCISLWEDVEKPEESHKSDSEKAADSPDESMSGAEMLLHVQPKNLDEVDLPKIENMPISVTTPAQSKTGKRMCPTCHGKIVTCIRKDGRKYECCERSPYNINIADRPARGDCTGWFQELDD